jgi:hypothetical protein
MRTSTQVENAIFIHPSSNDVYLSSARARGPLAVLVSVESPVSRSPLAARVSLTD